MNNPNILSGYRPQPNKQTDLTPNVDPLKDYWLLQAADDIGGKNNRNWLADAIGPISNENRATQPIPVMDNMIRDGFVRESGTDPKSINKKDFYAVDNIVDAYEEMLTQPGLGIDEDSVSVIGDVIASAVDSAIGYYKELQTSAEASSMPVLFESTEKGLNMSNFGTEQVAESVFRTISTITNLEGSNAAMKMVEHLNTIDGVLKTLNADLLLVKAGEVGSQTDLSKKQELQTFLSSYRQMLVASYGQIAHLDENKVVETNRNISSIPTPKVELTPQKSGGLLSRLFGRDRVAENVVDEINRTDQETGRGLLLAIVDNAKESTDIESGTDGRALLQGIEKNYSLLQQTEFVVNGDATVIELNKLFNDEQSPEPVRSQARAQLLAIAAEDMHLPSNKRRVSVLTMNREIAEATNRYAKEIISDRALSVENMTDEARNQAFAEAFTKARSEYGVVTETDEKIAEFFDRVVTDKTLRIADMVKLATTVVPLGINAFDDQDPQGTFWQNMGVDPNDPREWENPQIIDESLAEATKVSPERVSFISEITEKLDSIFDFSDDDQPLKPGALESLAKISSDKEFRNNLIGSDGTVYRADSAIEPMVYRDVQVDTDEIEETSGGRVGLMNVLSAEEMKLSQQNQTAPVSEFGTLPGLEQFGLDIIRADIETVVGENGEIKLTDEFVAKHLYPALVEAAQQAELEEKLTGNQQGIIKDLGGAENVQKLLDLLSTSAPRDLITVAENGVILYTPDLMNELDAISTEEGINEFDYLVGFIEDRLVPTVENQLPVNLEEVEVPYVEQRDPSVIDTANITPEDFRSSIANFLAIEKDPENPLYNPEYANKLNGDEIALLQRISGDADFVESIFNEHNLTGKSIYEIWESRFNVFSDGANANNLTDFINSAVYRLMPLFGEGSLGEGYHVVLDTSTGNYVQQDYNSNFTHNVTLDVTGWSDENLLTRVNDVADMIYYLSDLNPDSLEELQSDTTNLVNLEDRVLAVTGYEYYVLSNLVSYGETITTTARLEEVLIEKGFNVDRASHVAALFTPSTAEVVYNFLESHDVLPQEIVASADKTFYWQSFEPDPTWSVVEPENAIEVLTTTADADQQPTPQQQAEAVYVVLDSLIDNYDKLTEDQQNKLDSNLSIDTLKGIFDKDVFEKLINPSDVNQTLNDRLVSAGLATYDSQTGQYQITNPQIEALLSSSVINNLENLIVPTSPTIQQDETPFDWSTYPAVGTFEVKVDTTDETNPWHTAGSEPTSEELISRANNVFQLLGRIGNSSEEAINNANLKGLGIAEVQNLNQTEVDIITSSLTVDLINQHGSVEAALVSLGLEQPEAHAVAAIFENPDTAIEINNRLPILGQISGIVGYDPSTSHTLVTNFEDALNIFNTWDTASEDSKAEAILTSADTIVDAYQEATEVVADANSTPEKIAEAQKVLDAINAQVSVDTLNKLLTSNAIDALKDTNNGDFMHRLVVAGLAQEDADGNITVNPQISVLSNATALGILEEVLVEAPTSVGTQIDWENEPAVDKSAFVTTDWEEKQLADRASELRELVTGLIKSGTSVANLQLDQLSTMEVEDFNKVVDVINNNAFEDADGNPLTGAALESELKRLMGNEPWVNDVVAMLLNQPTVDMIMNVIPDASGTSIDWANFKSNLQGPPDLSWSQFNDDTPENIVGRVEIAVELLDIVMEASEEKQKEWENELNIANLREYFTTVESIDVIRNGLTAELIEEKGLEGALVELGLGSAANDFAALLTARGTISNILTYNEQLNASPEVPGVWSTITEINAAAPVPFDPNSEIWYTDADASQIAERADQVASVILELNKLDPDVKSGLNLQVYGLTDGSVLMGLTHTELNAAASLTADQIDEAGGVEQALIRFAKLEPEEAKQVAIMINNQPTVKIIHDFVQNENSSNTPMSWAGAPAIPTIEEWRDESTRVVNVLGILRDIYQLNLNSNDSKLTEDQRALAQQALGTLYSGNNISVSTVLGLSSSDLQAISGVDWSQVDMNNVDEVAKALTDAGLSGTEAQQVSALMVYETTASNVMRDINTATPVVPGTEIDWENEPAVDKSAIVTTDWEEKPLADRASELRELVTGLVKSETSVAGLQLSQLSAMEVEDFNMVVDIINNNAFEDADGNSLTGDALESELKRLLGNEPWVNDVVAILLNQSTVDMIVNVIPETNVSTNEGHTQVEMDAFYAETNINLTDSDNAWSKPFEDLNDDELNQRIKDARGLILRMFTYKYGAFGTVNPELNQIYTNANLGTNGLNIDTLTNLNFEELYTSFNHLTAENIKNSGGIENLMQELGYERNEIDAFMTLIENPSTAELVDNRLPTLFNTNTSIDWTPAITNPTLETWRDEDTRVSTSLGIIREIDGLNTTINDVNASVEEKELAQGAINALTEGNNISVPTVLGLNATDIQAINGVDWSQVDLSSRGNVEAALKAAGLSGTEAYQVSALMVHEDTARNILEDIKSAVPVVPGTDIDWENEPAVDKSAIVTTHWEEKPLADRASELRELVTGLVKSETSVAGLQLSQLSAMEVEDFNKVVDVINNNAFEDAEGNPLTGDALESELKRLLGNEPWVNGVVAILLNQPTVDMIMNVIPETPGTTVDWTGNNYTSAPVTVDLTTDIWLNDSPENFVSRLDQSFEILDRIVSANDELQRSWETDSQFNVANLKSYFATVESIENVRNNLTAELIEEKGLEGALREIGLGEAADDFAVLLTAKDTIQRVIDETTPEQVSNETAFNAEEFQVNPNYLEKNILDNLDVMTLEQKMAMLPEIIKTMVHYELDNVAGIPLSMLSSISIEDYEEISAMSAQLANNTAIDTTNGDALEQQLNDLFKDKDWAEPVSTILANPETMRLIRNALLEKLPKTN